MNHSLNGPFIKWTIYSMDDCCSIYQMVIIPGEITISPEGGWPDKIQGRWLDKIGLWERWLGQIRLWRRWLENIRRRWLDKIEFQWRWPETIRGQWFYNIWLCRRIHSQKVLFFQWNSMILRTRNGAVAWLPQKLIGGAVAWLPQKLIGWRGHVEKWIIFRWINEWFSGG